MFKPFFDFDGTKRIENWAKESKIINEQQQATQTKCSSLHVSLLVRKQWQTIC